MPALAIITDIDALRYTLGHNLTYDCMMSLHESNDVTGDELNACTEHLSSEGESGLAATMKRLYSYLKQGEQIQLERDGHPISLLQSVTNQLECLDIPSRDLQRSAAVSTGKRISASESYESTTTSDASLVGQPVSTRTRTRTRTRTSTPITSRSHSRTTGDDSERTDDSLSTPSAAPQSRRRWRHRPGATHASDPTRPRAPRAGKVPAQVRFLSLLRVHSTYVF